MTDEINGDGFPGDGVPELVEITKQSVDICWDRGMVPPLIMAIISPNGSVLVMRYERIDGAIVANEIAENVEPPGYKLPINIIVTDQKGETARFFLGDKRPDGSLIHPCNDEYSRG